MQKMSNRRKLIKGKTMKERKIDKISDEEFQQIVVNSNSYAECCRKIGLCDKGRYGTDLVRERCIQLNLSTAHFNCKGHSNTKKYTLDEILCENSSYKNISTLKLRLINENKLKYECAICGNPGVWNNKPLTLQLDHINGQHLDHRLENLRFICPNCHSQTETFSGKNKSTAC